jgi:hypothetical protein
MLHEAQGYRTSLEALMSVGRALLLTPSLESDSASSFMVLAEDVLEQADHQADLQVVDGVTEPQAQVELIMQDVLTPRLTEVEAIEQALQAKADSDEPVPFTTRDSETSASLESLNFKAEALGLFKENIDTVRAVISMEGMTIEAARPLVLNVARRMGDGLVALGVSMEDLEQTQVLGEMSDAVDRIEALVATAKEAAEESAESARAEAASIGSEGDDRIGDLIEQHRDDNPSGPKLDDGVTANTIEKDTPTNPDNGEGDVPTDPDADPALGDSTDPVDPDADPIDPVDPDADPVDPIDPDADPVDPVDPVDPDADPVDPEAEIEAANADADPVDPDADPVDPDADPVDPVDPEEDELDEEGNPKKKVSTESVADPIVIENITTRVQDVDAVVGIQRQLMSWLDSNGLLTADGKAALEAEVNHEFCLTTNMVVDRAGDVLVRHYDTWVAACIRDGETNTRALQALMDL